ncbi:MULTISPECIES: PRD domain-containing protein [Vagococcus]|uniref:Transcriptional antiterminator of lichenan operon, BglG family n=1 Tax=Vagococcus fluvialis bH819 TaxID=1255619 RepID=A0A1X6WKJ3_9ENTE|nr:MULTISPECIES: PRD domain-containing protein [Vagococcus]SLM84843.1 Transcriptional antiterminator of lichenan operon, BglG family [Vagococcus fluvialis bH819]HCM89148.1 PRD domain-containing protein [Vagococcus sp.]
MNQKEQNIIKYLLENQSNYITSQELAEEFSLSDRTIRTYINKLKPTVIDHGAMIHSKTGHGYQLEIKQRGTFDLFLKQQKVGSILRGDRPQVMEIEDRQNYILNKLLLEDAILTFEGLSERLFISQSSVTKDVNEIRDRLKDYHLIIQTKSGTGFWVEGLEQEKRHFIMDNFFGKNYRNPLKEHISNSDLFTDITFEELTIIILDESREERLKLSDVIIQNLVLHLSLAIKRIKEGFELTNSGINIDETNQKEYKVATKIMRRVEANLDIQFPKEEIGYLTLHLMAKSNQTSKRKNKKVHHSLIQMIQELSLDIGINLMDDYQLYNGLLEHIKPMLVRLDKNISLKNPLREDIKKNYPEAFELTKKHMKPMKIFDSYSINEDEWAYLSLHIMAAIEKNKNTRKLQVLIICATGYGSAQLLRNRVNNEFSNSLNVVDVLGYYELNENSLANIDLIISSINLSSVLFKVPVIHVSVFLNNQDIEKIKNETKIIDIRTSVNENSHHSLTNKEGVHYVDEHLSEKLFTVYTKPVTKEDVLLDLLTQLNQDEDPDYIEKMIVQIKQREHMGQIIFSESIVVPHPAKPIGITTKMAVGIIPNGINWNQNNKIQFVFLISPSYIENEGITYLTKNIVKLVDDLDTQQAILNDPSFNNFQNHFLKIANQQEVD